MCRIGKIARLPNHLREEVNRRLQDGLAAAPLLQWLNALPAVQSLLKKEFDGAPLNEPNLTHWRQGGYRDWLVAQNARALLAPLNDPVSFGHEALLEPIGE